MGTIDESRRMTTFTEGNKVLNVTSKNLGVVFAVFPFGPIYFVKYEDGKTGWYMNPDLIASDHNKEIVMTPEEYAEHAAEWYSACVEGMKRWQGDFHTVSIGSNT